MQSFFNPKTPFFDDKGILLVGARITFLSTDTSGEKITLKSIDGVVLENPLYTGSDGKFKAEKVPYIEDGVSYKVTVERPTGVSPIEVLGEIVNASELYELVDEFTVTSTENSYSGEFTTVVIGRAGVRAADPNLGSVICVGFDSMEDGATARVYTWVESSASKTDNGVNILSGTGTGYWLMTETCDMVDVRIGGVFPGNTAATNSQNIENLKTAISGTFTNKDCALYFPSGEYQLSIGTTFNSLILANGAKFRSASGTLVMRIAHLENRGGQFIVGSAISDARIIPVVTGKFRTSWIQGNLACAMFQTSRSFSAALQKADVVILDSFTDDSSVLDLEAISRSGIALTNKVFVLDTDAPTWLSYVKGKCPIIDDKNGILKAYKTEVTAVKCETLNVGNLSANEVDFEYTNVMRRSTLIARIYEEYLQLYKKLVATEITATKTSTEALNVNGGMLIFATETVDLTEPEKTYHIGDIVVVDNYKSMFTTSATLSVYIRYETSDTKKTYVNISTGCAMQFVCLKESSSESPYYMWAPLSNVTMLS